MKLIEATRDPTRRPCQYWVGGFHYSADRCTSRSRLPYAPLGEHVELFLARVRRVYRSTARIVPRPSARRARLVADCGFGCRGPERTLEVASSPVQATPPKSADASFGPPVRDAPETESQPASPGAGDASESTCPTYIRSDEFASGIMLEVDGPVWACVSSGFRGTATSAIARAKRKI